MKQIQFFWIGRWEPELNQILSMISNRNSENSCNKNHFDKAAPDYHIHRCSFRYKPREENTELSIEREAIPPPPPSHIHTPRRITFSEIVLWQGCFPWNSPRHPKLFLGQTLPESYREPWEILNHKGVIYTFVRRCLLQEQILFCSINVKTFSKNAGIEINLPCSALKR